MFLLLLLLQIKATTLKDWGCMHVVHIRTNIFTVEFMPRNNKVCFQECYSRGPYHYHCQCGVYYNYYVWHYLSINALEGTKWRTAMNCGFNRNPEV